MLSDTHGKQLHRYTPDYVVFDLETTGLSCADDAVVEISAVRVRGGREVGTFSTLVNPDRHIPESASSVNNIYDDMVAGSPYFETALREFLDFAGDSVLVGHNIASFDMHFLWRCSREYTGQVVGNDYIDTLRMARQFLPELDGHRLVDLAEHYGIPQDGAHRALNDCRMNHVVFEKLRVEILNAPKKGIPVCPRCGQALKKRTGKFGEFWGCYGYPECRFTRNIRRNP